VAASCFGAQKASQYRGAEQLLLDSDQSAAAAPAAAAAAAVPSCLLQVEEFMLWDLQQVASVISSSMQYKPNCCLVVIDFLVRHGLIAPEEAGYLRMVRQLRVGDPL
jgi:hypothetical protein